MRPFLGVNGRRIREDDEGYPPPAPDDRCISNIIAAAKATNNGRLNSMAMTEPQKRAAEEAVARGLMTKYHMDFPGFGPVAFFALAA